MKYTNLEDACKELRAMGKQFICPKDEFFGPLADEIEKLVKSNKFLSEMHTEKLGMLQDSEAELGLYKDAIANIRDAVLHQRYQLAETELEGNPELVNAILGVIDDNTPTPKGSS